MHDLEGMIDWPDDVGARDLDRRAFRFSHRMAGLPLFDPPRLEELGRCRTDKGLQADADRVELEHLEREPDYRELLTTIDARLRNLLGPWEEDDLLGLEASLLIASPGSSTRLELDPRGSFVLQLFGGQTLTTYPHEAGLVDHFDLEGYYARGDGSLQRSPEDLGEAAITLRLEPGQGAHRPRHSPVAYAVQGDEPSLSLHLDVLSRRAAREADSHRVNQLLRVAGFLPRPPGDSAAVDGMKRVVALAARRVAVVADRIRSNRPD